MTTTRTIIVRADPDQDDCLAAAEDQARIEHDLPGWDLDPRWTDDLRETVTMTLPSRR